jgi:hypothetical protein
LSSMIRMFWSHFELRCAVRIFALSSADSSNLEHCLQTQFRIDAMCLMKPI